MERIRRIGMLAAVALLAHGCAGRECSFQKIRKASRVEVRTNLNQPIATITDPAVTLAAADFLDKHHSGWYQPWAGTPIPPVNFYFYREEQLIDGFGLGREFIAATGRTCPRYITDLKPNESSAFLSSIGVKCP
jgi:hypothetical protein